MANGPLYGVFAKPTVVRAWKLRTADGQTLYVTKPGRTPRSGSSEPKG